MSREENRYYYQQLNKQQQKAYHTMLEGLLGLEASFPVPALTPAELAEIYFLIRLDHPEIFYTVSYRYRMYRDAEHVELLPDYLFSKKQILEHRQAMQQRIKKLVRQAADFGEKEKEQFVHDFICQNIRYDKLKKPYSHEITGALGTGVAVCEGIAKAVKALMDELGIWCIVALSEANPEKHIRYRHAWNVVKIGGSFYHLDCTFDNTLSSPDLIRYDYYNINDTAVFRDHEPVIRPIPVCSDGTHTWYREKKLIFTKMEEVKKRAAQAARKGKPFIVHWRGGYLTREVLSDLLQVLEEEGKKKNKHVLLSLNWPQAVLQIRYTDKTEKEQMVLEEANEGEKEE